MSATDRPTGRPAGMWLRCAPARPTARPPSVISALIRPRMPPAPLCGRRWAGGPACCALTGRPAARLARAEAVIRSAKQGAASGGKQPPRAAGAAPAAGPSPAGCGLKKSSSILTASSSAGGSVTAAAGGGLAMPSWGARGERTVRPPASSVPEADEGAEELHSAAILLQKVPPPAARPPARHTISLLILF